MCAYCEFVTYCGRECQKKHWRLHRDRCCRELRLTSVEGKEISVTVRRTDLIRDVRCKVQEKLGVGRTHASRIVQLVIGDRILDDTTRCSTLDLLSDEKAMSYTLVKCFSSSSLRDCREIFLTGVGGREISVTIRQTASVRDVRCKVQDKLGIGRTETSSIVQLVLGDRILDDTTRCSTLALASDAALLSYTVLECSSCPSLGDSSTE